MNPSVPQLALRYARALDMACETPEQQEQLARDARFLADLDSQVPGFREFCLSGTPGKTRAEQFVETILYPWLGGETAAAVRIMVSRGRLPLVPWLPAALEKIRKERENITDVVVETASPAGEALLHEVARHMETRTGGTVRIHTEVNPALLGGFRILWNNKIIDRSARGRVHALRRRMVPA